MIPWIPVSTVSVNASLDSCIVSVLAPPPPLPSTCDIDAFKNLGASNPLCLKNLESSVAIIASINTSGISL